MKQFVKIHGTKTDAKIKLTLRILVALYILYLTERIIESSVRHTSSLPFWVTVLVSVVFLVSSVAFGIYAWREYKRSSTMPASESLVACSEDDDSDSCRK